MKHSEILDLIRSDIHRSGGGTLFKNCILGKNSSLRFLFWLRLCKSDFIIVRTIARFQRVRLTRKFGVQISESCLIGAGFDIPHCLPIVIHNNAKIGKNCTCHQFVTIAGVDGIAPCIGDNCYIGTGACLVGNITIGNNVPIGANAVVTTSVPDNATVGGVPAKILHFNHPGRYIKNRV